MITKNYTKDLTNKTIVVLQDRHLESRTFPVIFFQKLNTHRTQTKLIYLDEDGD